MESCLSLCLATYNPPYDPYFSPLTRRTSCFQGGHVHAYQPADGGDPVNYGVQAYLNRNVTAAFFERFGVDLVDPDLAAYASLLFSTQNVDFDTGLTVDVDYGPVDAIGIPVALAGYTALAVQYQPWFENGYFQTGDVPEDLLLPFGEFLEKHDLAGALGILRNLLWLSDALDTPTWHVMAVVGQPQIAAFGLGITGPAFKWPATGSSETLYDNILTLLSDDVLLESTVSASTRSDNGTVLIVDTPSGVKKVNAKRVLFAATPSPDNVGPWDLDETEAALFDKFSWETLFVGVVNGTGLPSDVSGIRNAPDNAEALYLPNGSFCDAFTRAGDRDLFATRVIGTADLDLGGAEDIIFDSFATIEQAGTYDIASPNLVAIKSHGLTVPKVSSEELKNGFYNKLYALQGYRGSFWTGLTWAPDYTPILWDFTETLLPQIVAGL